MLCKQCGAIFSHGDSFCASCGYDLGATALLTALAEHAERPALELVRNALQGEYEIKEQVGRGGMGIVFRAFEKSLHREVALKVLPFAHVHDENLIERFTNEARTAAKLEHPNIVPVYRVGRSGDVIYFAMRYLNGPSLAELILESGSLAPRDIQRILIECAEALGYAHRHGVVHRDIKPDNIMFKESGEVVVCDFGIARAAASGSLTGTGMALGTPYYMSPEQFRARPLDGRSDIYSLGVVGYQCLTKELPFLGEDSFAIGYKHVTEPLPKPPLKTDEHRSLYAIIARMMAKEPADRYPDTKTLIADLASGASTDRRVSSISTAVTAVDVLPAVSERPTSVEPSAKGTPPTPLPRARTSSGLRRPGRRHETKSGFGAAAMAVLALGSVGGGGFWYVQSSGGAGPALEQARTTIQTGLSRLPLVGNLMGRPDPIAPDSQPGPNSKLQTTAFAPTTPAMLPTVVDSADSLINLGDWDSVMPANFGTDFFPPLANDSFLADTTTATGTLLLEGVGRGRLTIDDEPAFGLRHELPVGSHQLTVVSRGYAPYTIEVIVPQGDVIRHRVQMERTSHCDRFDDDYNQLDECFDRPPTLPDDQALLVPLDETVDVSPTLPAELVLLVRSDGAVEQVLVARPSDVQAFTTLARLFAKNLQFEAATKRGQAVDAWTRLQFYPKEP